MDTYMYCGQSSLSEAQSKAQLLIHLDQECPCVCPTEYERQ